MATATIETTAEAQIRGLVNDWARAVRTKDINAPAAAGGNLADRIVADRLHRFETGCTVADAYLYLMRPARAQHQGLPEPRPAVRLAR